MPSDGACGRGRPHDSRPGGRRYLFTDKFLVVPYLPQNLRGLQPLRLTLRAFHPKSAFFPQPVHAPENRAGSKQALSPDFEGFLPNPLANTLYVVQRFALAPASQPFMPGVVGSLAFTATGVFGFGIPC